MEWYYSENNERLGPVSDDELAELDKAGKITAETLVWREGWSDWRPWREAGKATPGSGNAACLECGKAFPTSEMIQYEGSWICPACKPVFFQKVKEGVAIGGEMHYAGFWIRLVAKIVDGIILQVVGIPLRFFMGNIGSDPHLQLRMFFLGVGISLLLNAAYVIFFLGKFGATPGKMALRLRVVFSGGEKISWGRACGRYFAEMLSSLTLGIGYIIAAFDDQKRALHDHICDTRVIRQSV